MGTPSAVIPVLRSLHDMPEVDVTAVVTPPDRPRGRGRQAEATPVKEAALSLGIPVLQPASLRGDAALAELAALAPDVMLVAAYGKLLPPAVLALPSHGCLNLHPSLLPRHRGPSPVATAILEGDAGTGTSLMLLDEGMDTGPVISRGVARLQGKETTGQLTEQLFELGAGLLRDNLQRWVNGELTAEPQDDALATLTRKLDRSDGRADFGLPADLLERQCRAYSPWPGLYTEWRGRTLKLLEVRAVAGGGPRTASPGVVLSVPPGSGAPQVATGHGSVSLVRVQLEGRRPVRGEDFVNGFPDIVGALLGETREHGRG